MSYDAHWVRREMSRTLTFWLDNARQKSGGYQSQVRGDGSLYASSQLLSASCRFVVNFSQGYRLLKEVRFLEAATDALQFICAAYRDPKHGGYVWNIDGRRRDCRKLAYGHAFAL